MTQHIKPTSVQFIGASGHKLVGDRFGDRGMPVLLLHGGGQTRHAWRKTAERLGREGMTAYAIDQRGHGDSEWVANGAYAFDDFADDLLIVADEIAQAHGKRPVMIGASLGGIASMLAERNRARQQRASAFQALVLVDITPRVEFSGIEKIHAFMRAHAREGFASVEEAADAVANYLPHRPRPRSNDGLKKNLRLYPDGRWRWHWDPLFIEARRGGATEREIFGDELEAAARMITVPLLLVSGASSEVVQEHHVRDFLKIVPHAEYVDVAGARHMVAGDSNDRFSVAIHEFLVRVTQ
ncbi:MAG TPA: alpha/beta fold hydrolase [Xanthobacteraceae bacterium]|nr:alpha/beta fold hydrolase [Xanthobacteraceae bacterium]